MAFSMKKHPTAKILKTKEDNVTVIHILGLDDHPSAYKRAYLQLLDDIRRNMFKIIASGEENPVIRTFPSIEIH